MSEKKRTFSSAVLRAFEKGVIIRAKKLQAWQDVECMFCEGCAAVYQVRCSFIKGLFLCFCRDRRCREMAARAAETHVLTALLDALW